MRYVKQIDSVGKAVIFLDVEDTPLPEVGFDITPLLTFRVDTYNVLKANASQQNWDAVFKVVNMVLNDEFTEEERIKYVSLIVVMHYNILKDLGKEGAIDREKTLQLEDYLASLVAKFDKEVNLVPRLRDFVHRRVPIVATENAGERAIDSAEMTFYYDDVVGITTMVMVDKLLTPIYGTFIECTKKRMDTRYKETHCATIGRDIVANNLGRLDEKLYNYIKRTVENSLPVSAGTIYHGFTMYNTIEHIKSILRTRRFTTVDILEKESNIMKYIISCIRSAVKASNSSSNKMAIAEIHLPSESGMADDGNASNLEKETIPSSKTFDFDLLIEEAALELYNKFTAKMDLDMDVLAHAEAYHTTSHAGLNSCASYLIATAFGTELCGGQSVQSIPNPVLNKLLPMLQVYLHGQGYDDLVHLVTAIDTDIPKAVVSGTDNQLKASWNSSDEYRMCANKFPIVVGDLTWDTRLKEIVDSITSRTFVYNTSPVLWDLLGEGIRNGQPMTTIPSISKSICSFILEQYP